MFRFDACKAALRRGTPARLASPKLLVNLLAPARDEIPLDTTPTQQDDKKAETELDRMPALHTTGQS